MIQIGRFTIEQTSDCWILAETHDGKPGKCGKIREQKKNTYHANLRQVAAFMVDRYAGECDSVTQLNTMLVKAANQVEDFMAEMIAKDAK